MFVHRKDILQGKRKIKVLTPTGSLDDCERGLVAAVKEALTEKKEVVVDLTDRRLHPMKSADALIRIWGRCLDAGQLLKIVATPKMEGTLKKLAGEKLLVYPNTEGVLRSFIEW